MKMYCYWTCALLIICATLAHGQLLDNMEKDEGRTDSFLTSETDRGKYFKVTAGNGIIQEQAFLVKDQDHNNIFEVHGHFSYHAPDGKVIDKWYRADENGIEYIDPTLDGRIGSDVMGSLVGGGVG